MSLPVRSAYALRRGAPAPILLGAIAVAVMFAATPFLIPEVAARLKVSVGIAGGISLAQVTAFAAVTFVLPKFLRPSARIFRIAGVALLVGNLISAAAPTFAVLIGSRLIAGAGAGALTWLAWSEAMHRPRSLADISAAGPLSALIGSPVLAAVSTQGDHAVYLMLAVVALPLIVLRPGAFAQVSTSRRVSASRSNRFLLAALFLVTFAGASLFIYESVAASEIHGLGPVAGSFAFSLNAAGGLLGARLSVRHRRPGLWMASAGPAAALTIVGGHPVVFFAGLAWWGFAFWMGIPGVMQMLAARSLEPGERAGDAQGAMASGRALAPLMGGAFVDTGGYTALAIAAGIGLTAAGLGVAAVQEGRDRLPPRTQLAGV